MTGTTKTTTIPRGTKRRSSKPAQPTKAPRSSARCWPHPCKPYHSTEVHLDGSEPCMCPCHLPKVPGDDTGDAQRAAAAAEVLVGLDRLPIGEGQDAHGLPSFEPEAISGPRAPTFRYISTSLIDVDANVREDLGDVSELADSIRSVGLLQPITVRHGAGDRYVLVLGHRRLAAAKLAGVSSLPAVVRRRDDERQVVQLVENIQRSDLSALEEARAIQALLEADPKLNQAKVAKRLGRSAPWVANRLRLLGLGDISRKHLEAGRISASHAEALLGLQGVEQDRMADRAASGSLALKDLEREVKWEKERSAQERRSAEAEVKERAAMLAALEAAEVPKDAKVRIGLYGVRQELLEQEVVAAGWTDLVKGWGRPQKSVPGCDCEIWGVETAWYGDKREPKVERICLSEEHQAAAEAARVARLDAEQKAESDLEDRVRDGLADALRPTGDVQRQALRLLLAAELTSVYGLKSWASRLAGKDLGEKDAWTLLDGLSDEDIARELGRIAAGKIRYGRAEQLVRRFRDFAPDPVAEEPKAKAKRPSRVRDEQREAAVSRTIRAGRRPATKPEPIVVDEERTEAHDHGPDPEQGVDELAVECCACRWIDSGEECGHVGPSDGIHSPHVHCPEHGDPAPAVLTPEEIAEPEPARTGKLVRPGETADQALKRLERRKDYAKVIGTDVGQALLEAAEAERKAVQPRRTRKPKSEEAAA